MSEESPSQTAGAETGEGTAGDAERAGSDLWSRRTAPQTPYTMRQVGIGFVVLVVGAVVAFGIPLLLA